jgi:hypothetical protein
MILETLFGIKPKGMILRVQTYSFFEFFSQIVPELLFLQDLFAPNFVAEEYIGYHSCPQFHSYQSRLTAAKISNLSTTL